MFAILQSLYKGGFIGVDVEVDLKSCHFDALKRDIVTFESEIETSSYSHLDYQANHLIVCLIKWQESDKDS